ncbi:MAG: GNAT family N-acetyltransferase [Chloroflexota bacterium]
MPQDRSALYFRRYHSSDRASVISGCYGGNLPPHLLSLLNNQGSPAPHSPHHAMVHILGIFDQQVVASGFLFKTPAYAEIADLFVVPPYRNQGIGRSLIRYLEEIAHQAGWRPIELTVLEDNRDALRLYKRLGFVEKSQFQTDGNRVLLMSKA